MNDGMKIDLYCPDPKHPAIPVLHRFIHNYNNAHLFCAECQLTGGTILFAIGCPHRLTPQTISLYTHTLVPHASDLPKGRGWSPVIHEIRQSRTDFTMSVIEAVDEIDAGPIVTKIPFVIESRADFTLIRHRINTAMMDAMADALTKIAKGKPPQPQPPTTPTYYPRLTPEDSEIDPHTPLSGQFDRLRSCDPDRFPATIRLRGRRYKLTLEDMGPDNGRKTEEETERKDRLSPER